MNDANDENIEIDLPVGIKRRWFGDIRSTHLLAQLRMTRYAMYTTSLVDHSQYLLDNLARFFPRLDELTMTDATAGIGGNSRIFAGVFRKTFCIEINRKSAEIMDHNFRLLGIRGRTKIININYLRVMHLLKQDIIFLDPPWGGINYKKQKCADLYLYSEYGPVNVATLVADYLADRAKIIIIKAPPHFNYLSVMDRFQYVEVLKIMKSSERVSYHLVILSNILPKEPLTSSRVLSTADYRSVIRYLKK